MLDLSKLSSIVIAGADMKDYPDFCDAYIESADYDGWEMTEEELDKLNQNREYVYEQVIKWIF